MRRYERLAVSGGEPWQPAAKGALTKTATPPVMAATGLESRRAAQPERQSGADELPRS